MGSQIRMMGKSFGQTSQVITNRFGKLRKLVVQEIYNELTQTNSTPVDTGKLRYSFRYGPTPTDYDFKYVREKNYYPKPEPANMDKYRKNWGTFYIWNNSKYLKRVNDSKKHINFVQRAVKKGERSAIQLSKNV